MGAVYLAHREDGEFEQTVAIKVLRQALPSPSALERFRQERRLLAHLEHPNIARLLDGGTNSHGLPYLVMEFVQGQPIDRFCVQRALSLRARLKLFCKVCAAVGEAHRNLIVHRDLKASNILVTADGEPKLLDFGIAKALHAGTFEQTPQTEEMSRLMTPEFASPEQIRGDVVTTASDVYALGALLYQLLTGAYPYARWRSNPLQLQNAICHEEPRPPSQNSCEEGVSPADLRGDLDAIVAKAMCKDAQHRYSGAADMAADIGCYLTGATVAARQGTLRYRMQKYLRRHRTAALLSVLVFLGISLLVSVYTGQIRAEQRQAESQRVRAEQGWQSADAISEFVAGLFIHTHAEQQRHLGVGQREEEVTANQLLNSGLARLDVSLQGEPLVAARLMMTMARAQLATGQVAAAANLFQQALQLRQTHLAADDQRVVASMQEYGTALVATGQFGQAQVLLDLVAQRVLQARGAGSGAYAHSLLRAANAYLHTPRPKQSVRDSIVLALEIFEAQTSPDLVAIAIAYGALSRWHQLWKQHAQALEWVKQKRNTLLRVYSPDDRQMLGVDLELGEALWWVGNMQEAITAVQRGLKLMDLYKGARHPDSAPGYATLNRAHQALGNYAAAYEDLSNLRLIVAEPGYAVLKPTPNEVQAAWAEYLFAVGHPRMARQVLAGLETNNPLTSREQQALTQARVAESRANETVAIDAWLNFEKTEQLRKAIASDGYIHKPNSGVSLYNLRALKDVTPADCAHACTQEKEFYCKTFDYNKLSHICYLQDMSEADVGALKTDYEHDRYDHYQRLGVDDHHAGLPSRPKRGG